MDCATTRAFAKVKSSAMMPRQPSVPNLMESIYVDAKYTRGEQFANSRIGLLQEVFPPLLFEPFHDFANVLGAFARANEQRVGRIHDDQVVHTDQGGNFSRARDEIAAGVEGVARSGEHVAVRGVLAEEQSVHRGPGADIAPAHF